MRTIAILIGALTLPASAGCTVSDALFAALGRYQSDAYSSREQQMNYSDSIEKAEKENAKRVDLFRRRGDREIVH
ncbi:MAG: hypothetical protein HYX69_13655 [Planctomycetia bacterium]|nr:hypothetical protein [Planctomycetia bacterium]